MTDVRTAILLGAVSGGIIAASEDWQRAILVVVLSVVLFDMGRRAERRRQRHIAGASEAAELLREHA